MNKYGTPQNWSEADLAEMRRRFTYNPDDGTIRAAVDRGHKKAGEVLGVKTTKGYMHISFKPTFLRAHRLAWFLHHGEWPMKEIDHINGDTLDNRLCNLRLATRSENRRNIGVTSRNRLGVKGVSFHAGRYRAVIYIRIKGEKKKIDLGRFDDLELAGLAYATAADRYFGEFARTN